MNILFVKHFVVGSMVPEIPRVFIDIINII